MSKLKTFVGAAIVAAAFAGTAAQAVITTFAGYSQIGNNSVRWINNGTGNPLIASNGTGGSLVSNTAQVNFYFLNVPVLPALGNILANWTLSATVVNSPASATVIPGNPLYLNQSITNATFSFTNVNAFTVGSTTYAAGSNLLSGTFSGNLGGFTRASAGGIAASTSQGDPVTFTSDVVTFAPGSEYDLAINLTSIANTLARSTVGGPKALRSFRASSSGTFSSDPAPVGVPEPEMWGLMIVGFGLVGVQMRRRTRKSAVVA
jgi:hypothetical protein